MLTSQPTVFRLTLIALALVGSVFSTLDLSYSYADDDTFHLNATKTQFLPDIMYGHWSIKATVVDSDTPPGMYQPMSYEVWSLERDSKHVTIANVANSAKTEISVDQVRGQTATFHHESMTNHDRLRVIEVPTITVEGDRMWGVNKQQLVYLDSHGNPEQIFNITLQLEGSRLSQGHGQFSYGTPRTNEQPTFTVEPLKHEN